VPSDALHRHVAAQIRALAERRGMSLNKLADFAGISRSHLGRLLRGAHSPTLEMLAKIAAALDAELRDLLP
jgi:transcriptional regulator with XRE-family HTH domain